MKSEYDTLLLDSLQWFSVFTIVYDSSPDHFGTGDRSHGRQFFHGLGMRGMVQGHHIYCALYFYYYYTRNKHNLFQLL